jgi:hypothetical protein
MKLLRFLIDLEGDLKKFAWMSLQDDSSISVGLSDRAFIAPEFKAKHFIWNFYNRRTLNYLVPHTPEALEPIQNPHFTFHPPLRFHLRAEDQPALFHGIANVDLVLEHQQDRYEWLRIGSKPVGELRSYSGTHNEKLTEILRIPAPAPRSSVGLAVDFIKPSLRFKIGTGLLNTFEDWYGRRLLVRAESIPIQDVTTLGWFHHY